VKKSTIWIVVTLMAIALIGLSWFQVYWINNVVRLSKERFEKDALASIYRVTQRLERNEMATIASNSFAFISSSSTADHDTADMVYSIELSKGIDSTQHRTWFKSNTNDKIKVVIRTDSSNELHEFVNDTAFTSGGVQVMASISSDTAFGKATIDRLHKKRKVFTRVVEEMMFHELGQTQRVHPAIIDSLLREEFNRHGIYLSFDFGVYDNGKKDFRILSTSNREALEKSPLKASLFPNDILVNGLSLVVNFPQKNQYLLNKVWASLLISVVFILIIIGTFSYVVYTIIRQKKISDLKNDFINNMTHEFKTPIATVSLATEALHEKKVLASQTTMLRYLGVIQQESKRLGVQVEKVLQLASMDKNNLSLNIQQTSLNLLVESAVDRARFQVEEKNGSLSVELADNEIEIMADETHLSNAIFNLLDNAVKYSPTAPEICIKVAIDKASAIVTVFDKGVGLTKEQQHHIFDKFYRVPTGNLHDVKGFGLGLNYVKYVVEAHNGVIQVDSQLGRGSSFKIILPLGK
jgi:two-component system, OmpR family, phosphate regulon sensor histidine kinase PhoR